MSIESIIFCAAMLAAAIALICEYRRDRRQRKRDTIMRRFDA